MLCGLTRIVSRIKHMLFFSFSKKYRPFEHLKCHECLWCKFFDECKNEHDYMLSLDATSNSFRKGTTHAVYTPVSKGTFDNPIESIDTNSIYRSYMKTHKNNVYGKCVK